MRNFYFYLLGFVLITGCATNPPPVFSPVPQVQQRPNALATLQTAMSQMQSQAAERTALVTAQPKTNGIVMLAWNSGEPVETWIRNKTLGVDYFAGAAETITLGRQLVGTNEYVAFNVGIMGTNWSNTVLAPVAGDQTSVSIEIFTFKVKWPGAAGTLQSSTNLIYWRDVGPMPAGGAVIVTNNGVKEFFRVRVL